MRASTYFFSPGRYRETFHRTQGQWVRDVVLGANDGLVSIMALVAGVAGAASGRTVLIAGIAGVLAGAMSMGLGAFVAARSYRAFYRHEESRERWEMENLPDVEREEIRDIYRHKGFEGAQLDTIVETITRDPEVWLRVMMTEELNLMPEFGRPIQSAVIMFAAFVAGGVLPVLPFFFSSGTAGLLTSIGLTAAGLIAAGAARSRFTGERPIVSGLELVAMAGAGVAVAYGIGRLVGAAV